VCPAQHPETTEMAAEAGLPLVVDEGGLLASNLGIEVAPTAVFILDMEPVSVLRWPFTEEDLVIALASLMDAKRGGPWELVGNHIPASVVARSGREFEQFVMNPDADVTLLIFAAEGCPACADIAASVEAISTQVPVALVFAGSAVGSGGEPGLSEKQTIFTFQDSAGMLARELSIRVVPTFLVIDRDRRVMWVQEGATDVEELFGAVCSALAVRAMADDR